jgi:hypothetical protein
VVDTARPAYAPPLFLAGGGRFVLFEGEPDRVPFWYVTRDARTGQPTAEVMGSGQQYHSPVMLADRRLVAAHKGIWLGVFRADDFGAGPVVVLRNDNRRESTGLAFHPSGRCLAATSNDAAVKLYDTTSWKIARAGLRLEEQAGAAGTAERDVPGLQLLDQGRRPRPHGAVEHRHVLVAVAPPVQPLAAPAPPTSSRMCSGPASGATQYPLPRWAARPGWEQITQIRYHVPGTDFVTLPPA